MFEGYTDTLYTIFCRGARQRQFSREGIVFTTKGFETNRYWQAKQKWTFFPYLTQQTQVNSKLIIHLNIKPKIIELPE